MCGRMPSSIDAINDIKNALEGLLEPTYKEHILGRAQVIQVLASASGNRGRQSRD